MKKKTALSVAASTLVTTLAVVGVTYAATPAGNDASLLNKGTVEVDSLKVGKQGTGGVTFFNGTIVNSTTENGVDNPVTFGDDVRIDGRVFRGSSAGIGDSQPFIINDNAQVAGSLEVGGVDVFAEIASKADKTRMEYLSLDSTAFVPESNTHQYTRSPHLSPTNSASIVYYAPVSIPDGSKLKEVAWSYKDNSSSGGVIISLEEVDASNGSVTTVFNTASTNAENSPSFTSKTSVLNDNELTTSAHSYRMKVTLLDSNYSLAYVNLKYETSY